MTAVDHEYEAEKAEYRRDTTDARPPELKPCPFCGSAKTKEVEGRIGCYYCGAENWSSNWNTRAESGLVKELAVALKTLREDIRMLRDGEWQPDEDSCNASLDVADAALAKAKPPAPAPEADDDKPHHLFAHLFDAEGKVL